MVLAARILLAALFGVLLMRMFFPGAGMAWGGVLAVFLAGLAYIMEYFRKKRGKPGPPA